MFEKLLSAIKIIIIEIGFKAGEKILQLAKNKSIKAIQKPINQPKSNSIVLNIKVGITWIRKFVKGTNESERKKEEIRRLINAVAEISYPITLSQEKKILPAIYQLSEIVESDDLLRLVTDESLENLFIGLSNFYKGQYAYTMAERLLREGLRVIHNRLGKKNHPTYSTIRDGFIDRSNELLKLQLFGSGSDYLQIRDINQKYHRINVMTISGRPSLYFSQADFSKFPIAIYLFAKAIKIQSKELGWGHSITQNTITEFMMVMYYTMMLTIVVIALLMKLSLINMLLVCVFIFLMRLMIRKIKYISNSITKQINNLFPS
jgi:hypothetical protein